MPDKHLKKERKMCVISEYIYLTMTVLIAGFKYACIFY